MDFIEFPKIARLSRPCVITEKIDGTNAQICISKDGEILAGSRTRWITPEQDNFGFARWVKDNEEELIKLGPGQHFGEWWGKGVQRGYDLGEKRFSLFNTGRWADRHVSGITWEGEGQIGSIPADKQEWAPKCCYVVPVLYNGLFTTGMACAVLDDLDVNGSKAAPGFKKPEGIVIYHIAAKQYFKKTLDKDEEWKGRQ